MRHGLSCSVLSDEEARQYDILFNSGFGEWAQHELARRCVMLTPDSIAYGVVNIVHRLAIKTANM